MKMGGGRLPTRKQLVIFACTERACEIGRQVGRNKFVSIFGCSLFSTCWNTSWLKTREGKNKFFPPFLQFFLTFVKWIDSKEIFTLSNLPSFLVGCVCTTFYCLLFFRRELWKFLAEERAEKEAVVCARNLWCDEMNEQMTIHPQSLGISINLATYSIAAFYCVTFLQLLVTLPLYRVTLNGNMIIVDSQLGCI